MGYLDLDSYEKLIEKQTNEPVTISVDLLKDKTDRTLTLGKNANGTTLHVFIKDGILHAHEYAEFPNEDYFTVTWFAGDVKLTSVRPTYYAIPRATDAEFAALMLSMNHGLEFAEWYAEVNKVDESTSGYFGVIRRLE